MSYDSTKKNSQGNWLKWIIYPYPLLMIGMFYIGWKTLFYLGLIPILFLVILGIVSNIKFGNWKQIVITLLTWIIFSEIGYLITDSTLDGICMGCYIALLCASIQNVFNKYR